MARPKGVKQKINPSKYWLPDGVTCLENIDYANKTKYLKFLDSTYGEFTSTFYNLQKAKASTHPKAVTERRKNSLKNIDNKKTAKKRQATMLQRYGVFHALHKAEFLDKAKTTTNKNYGVSNPAKSKQIQKKIKLTCLNKYGTQNPLSCSEVKNKVKSTLIKKYGVDNYSKLPEFKGKFKATKAVNKITNINIDKALEQKKYIIYGLVDPDSKEIRYIGRSSTGISRALSHKNKSLKEKNNHKKNWILSLLSRGKMYEIIIIQNVGTYENLGDLERYWIAYYKQFGKLTNWALGG